MFVYVLLIALLIFIVAFYLLKKDKGDSIRSDSNGLENDAKRFARLLVSEIKLYNESKVERGLQNKNLSDSLRDEIAEARSKYNKRIASEDMRSYFDDVLIEILANGDKSKFDSGIKSSLR